MTGSGGVAMKQARTSFFEKKAAKKLLLMGPVGDTAAGPIAKSFLVLFFKKERLTFPA
jgi:hypothetical protein